MANAEIRVSLTSSGVRQWEVAERLGIPETTFSRMMRRELPEEKKTAVRKAIQEIKREKLLEVNQ